MKKKHLSMILPMAVGIAAGAAPGIARAEYDPYAPQDQRIVREENHPMYTDIGVGLEVGGGVSNFTNNFINSITDVGGAWTARLVFGTRSPVAFEAAYIGTAQNIRSLGLSSGSVLMANGAEGDLRLNLIPTSPLSPYIFGGAAWKHYNIVNQGFANTSSLQNSADVLELPFGAGLAWNYMGFILDARFDYRPSFYDNILRAPPDFLAANPGASNSGLNNWSATARVGVEF
jgi:hypothetical protein